MCDDFFGNDEASVVCYQLGYSRFGETLSLHALTTCTIHLYVDRNNNIMNYNCALRIHACVCVCLSYSGVL